MNKRKSKTKSLALSLALILGSCSTNIGALEGNVISGKNRVETSLMLADKSSKKDTLILASGENDKLIDSLVFGPLSAKLNVPIIVNVGENLSKEVSDYIQKNVVKNVIIAGGPSSISTNIENSLKGKSITVKRIFGKDRFETSKNVKSELGNIEGIFLIGKNSLADAISASSIAGIKNYAIIVYKDSYRDLIEKSKNVYIVGGKSSINSDYLTKRSYPRISGSNRYKTNIALIRAFADNFLNKSVVVTSGEDKYLVDGLVAGPYAARLKAPVLFDEAGYRDYLNIKSTTNINPIFIGGRVVNTGLKKSIDSISRSTSPSESYTIKREPVRPTQKSDESSKPSQKQEDVNKPTTPSKPTLPKTPDSASNPVKPKDPVSPSDKEKTPEKPEKKEVVKLESTTGLPQKYDLRNVDGKSYLTKIKNQYYDGGCRSFASLAALESHIMYKVGEELDLSENNMENRHDFTFKANGKKLEVREGRNSLSDLSYLVSGKGPILESQDQYIPMKHKLNPAPYLSEEAKNSLIKDNDSYKSEATVQNEAKIPKIEKPVRSVLGFEFLKDLDTEKITSPEDLSMKQIKEAIKNNGPVVSNIYMQHDENGTFPYSNATTYNHKKAAYYSSDYKSQANHAITIVGWDDTFSKDNFVTGHQPDIDGAWIVRDAQTENFGEKGYFYVSFKSSKICTDAYVFNDVRPANEFKGVYQHDEVGVTGFISHDKFGDKTVLFNRYEIKDENQKLDSVGFYTTKPNAKCEIFFTDNFDKFSREFSMNAPEDVESIDEKLSDIKIFSSTVEKAGYHTIKLPEKIAKAYKKNSKIGLGIYVKNDDKEDEKHEFDMAVEINDKSNPNKNNGEKALVNKNETFAVNNMLGNEYEISDLTFNPKEKINACIKLYYK